VIHNIKRGAS